MRELTYFVATTLDGFIAAPDGDFGALLLEGDHLAALAAEYPDALPAQVHALLGARPDRSRFDTVLMGWSTYAVGLPHGVTSPYPHLRQLVFSRTRTSPDPAVEVTSADPVGVVRALKAEEGSGLWLCGGGKLAAALEEEVDELVLKVSPVVLGAGVPLFDRPSAPRRWEPAGARSFDSGVVFRTYRRPGP